MSIASVSAHRAAPPSYEELAARAEALVPTLRERAEQTERLRRIPDATLADLHASGLFRMLQPARVGGSELPFDALVKLSATIARGCGSTGWVLANLASHHWMLAMWPAQAQDEVWGASPDALIGSALVFPVARAERVAGGYRLSGRWPFSSGIDACAWNIVGAICTDEFGDRAEYRFFLLPRADYTIVDTWRVAGLAGTGSNDVVAENVFVPEHRSLAVDATKGGLAPGSAVNPGPLYRLPVIALFGFVVGCVTLGIAAGAVDDHLQAARTKSALYSGKSVADFTTVQVHVAEAAALVASAERLVEADCREATEIAERHGVPTLAAKARYRRDAAFAADLCARAVDRVFTATGGSAIYDSNPLQRAFRDVHAGKAHHALSWDVNASLYGRVALGLAADAPTL